MTLKNMIEKQAQLEPILGVVIGEMGWGDYGSEDIPNYDKIPKNILLTWKEALPWLQYEFSCSYGAPECNAITAWTKSKVIAIYQYDGSTDSYSLPRNPIDHKPIMVGG